MWGTIGILPLELDDLIKDVSKETRQRKVLLKVELKIVCFLVFKGSFDELIEGLVFVTHQSVDIWLL